MLHRVKKENDMHEGKWNGLGGKNEDGEDVKFKNIYPGFENININEASESAVIGSNDHTKICDFIGII